MSTTALDDDYTSTTRRRKVEEEKVQQDEMLDIDEQEEMIRDLHKRSQYVNEIYRTAFLVAGVLLTAMFLYFFYTQEEFGEAVGRQRASVIHFLTAIGFVVMCYRSKTGRRNSYLVVSETQNPNSVSRTLDFDSPASPSKSDFSLLTDSSATVTKTNSLDSVINDNAKIDTWQQVNPWHKESRLFFVALIISVIQFALWYGPLQANLNLGFPEAWAKPAVFVFPAVLPLYTVATEYAIFLMQKTENEVHGLHKFKYQYKKLY